MKVCRFTVFHYPNLTSKWAPFHLFSDCYHENSPLNEKANHTSEFERLWFETLTCFKQYLNVDFNTDNYLFLETPAQGHLCTNCSKIYNELRSYFWEYVVPTNDKELLSGVCYDIRDRFNLTGIIWKDTFNCESPPYLWSYLLPTILIANLCFFICVYTFEPFIFPKWLPRFAKQAIEVGKFDNCFIIHFHFSMAHNIFLHCSLLHCYNCAH